MLESTLQKIEDLLTSSPQLDSAKKQQLLDLVSELKRELSNLSQADRDKVLSAVSQSHAKTAGFERSIEQFELSHPKLYQIMKDLSFSLNGLGV
ncbi:MAG: hypothetical protein K0Q57_1289 [Gammaproteobacteria bacterium]|jgi:hypothetical protein|nr:hypothetical protein [Gammaproteobacteria bacterium]